MLTDAVLLTIYAALAVLVVASTVSFAVRGLHQKLSPAYYWISGCLVCWLALTFAYHITTNPWLAGYLDVLTFPFIAFLPVAFLLFVRSFYRGGTRFSRGAVACMCIIPAVTTVFSVVPSLNWLIRTDYVMLQMYPLHIPDYSWNVWCYVHIGYSYLLMLLCTVLVLMQYSKQPREYRATSILMVVGIIIIGLSDLPFYRLPDSIIDNTLVGACISMVVLYFAIVNNPAVEFLAAARKALYNNMDVPVFILDKQDRVLDMNRSAQELLRSFDALPQNRGSFTFCDVRDAIDRIGGTVTDNYTSSEPHIFLSLHNETVVLNQVRRELIDKKGRLLGSYVAMMDITSLSRFVDELQYRAEVDVLTGIPNRRSFERRVTELNVPENLPLSLIVGDVNHLKRVNDEMGHKQGDLLLKRVAAALADACPENGFAARTGGDEFIMVLPRCDGEAAHAVMDGVRARLHSESDEFFGAAISLGHITKHRAEQDIQALVHEADQVMYSQKKYDRRNGPNRGKCTG